MRKLTVLLTAAMLMLPVVAAGDIVVFKDGRRIEGRVTDLEKNLRIDFEFGHIIISKSLVDHVIACDTPRQKYEKMLAAISSRDVNGLKKLQQWCAANSLKKETRELAVKIGRLVLEKKESAIDPKDASSLFELAMWCRRNGYADSIAQSYLWKVLTVDPDHAMARKMLGYRKFRGQWLKKKEIEQIQKDELDKEMRLIGMVKYSGQWLKPDAAKYLSQMEELEALREDLERQRRQLEDDRRNLSRERAELDRLNRTLYDEQTKLERREDNLEHTARTQADLAIKLACDRAETARLKRDLERREADMNREKEELRDGWDEINREKYNLHLLRRRLERERRKLTPEKK